MKNLNLKDGLLVIGLLCLLVLGCKPDRDERDAAKIDLTKWTEAPRGSGTVFYNDSSWVFVYDSLNYAEDCIDTVIFGPFKGHRPLLDQFEYFRGDFMDEQDDRWVIEFLGPEGCTILTFGFKDGVLVLYNKYVLKGSNCGSTNFDENLKRKTILGPTYDNDSLRVLVLNYETGERIDSSTTSNGDYRDIELINGHFVKISQRDSVYIDVDITTDIQSRYVFPGKFIRARENGDGCKVIVIKNGNGYFSYVLCPDAPINHISNGVFMYGDSLTDVQAHSIGDTARFVVSTYDKQNRSTRIDVIDTTATRMVQRDLPGKLNAAKMICDGRVKAFILEDTLAGNGEGEIYLDAVHLTKGSVKDFNPKEVKGKIESISTLTAPCGLRIRIRDANGVIRSQEFFF